MDEKQSHVAQNKRILTGVPHVVVQVNTYLLHMDS